MTNHLPECFYFLDDFGDGERCICDRVRTCEQRVLDAAREAVAETQRWHEFSWGMDDDGDGEYVKTEEALAAIDSALFATYYLLQASRTGYHYRTVFVTRNEQAGREALDKAVDSHHHYRLVDAATSRVLAIRRPQESE